MALVDRIKIARRFQRSIRIDTDLGDPRALEGFVCPQSSADVLLTMARHVAETGQGAFTWTGPYGSGKSSLVVALAALLNGKAGLQEQAAKVFGRKLAKAMWEALPTGSRGWRVVPVVGRRDDPVKVIGEAMHGAGLVSRRPRGGWTEENLIRSVSEAAAQQPRSYGGLVLFIDEMGKFLEAAAHEGTDLYVFQQLAEAASRSGGRLILVGVLHQAFEEYAHRLSHEVRDEWAKIQGRFIDLAVNTAGDEQIDLISRAIESDHRPKKPGRDSILVAEQIRGERRAETDRLTTTLESCWPLHPVVAALLGPISRRRFGQNQRSIFGFLNSSEPNGFQEYLRRADDDELFGPDRLWDYLRANLEPSILASPDGHRWALAAEALERCEATGGDALHLKLLKSIAVVDLFKERSGLVANVTLLRACARGVSSTQVTKALNDLKGWSLVIFKKYLDAFAIYAGSDFDIDQALRDATDDTYEVDFSTLQVAAGLQPLLAKRHYHETGTLRWFDVNLTSVQDVMESAANYRPTNGTIGQLLLVIPTEGETEEHASEKCREAARLSDDWDIVVGISKRSWAIVALARELLALEKVRDDHAELAGDAVARREIAARLAAVQAQLEGELRRSFDSAFWYRKHHSPKAYRQAELNSLASELSDRRFDQCPRLSNELLNRQKPSSNAVAAQNELLRRMVLLEGEERLGIKGFPAEGGLFASLLDASGLYQRNGTAWQFVTPRSSATDPANLAPMWEAARAYVTEHSNRTVRMEEIYDLWRRPPYGVKDGLLPILGVAFILTERSRLAVYREGVFRAHFDDVDVQYLSKDASIIQLRWMDLSEVARKLLSAMAEVVRSLDADNALANLEPIDVARGLVAIYDQLPPCTKRTMRLSSNAVQVREIFKRAHDPNEFLFDHIPAVVGKDVDIGDSGALTQVIASLREGLEELVGAYPAMLSRLCNLMLTELDVPNQSPQALAELRERAENVRQLAGDFHLEAFVGRLTQFDGSQEALEGIASLAASKPPRDWVDPDIDRASVDLADMAQRFLRAETFTRVKGRPEKRHAMAVVVGLEGRPTPLLEEFDLAEADRVAVNDVIERVANALDGADTKRRNVILAALAELSARYIQEHSRVRRKGQERVTR